MTLHDFFMSSVIKQVTTNVAEASTSSSYMINSFMTQLVEQRMGEDNNDDNDNFLILILTLMLLIAMITAIIILTVVAIRRRPQKERRFLVSHGGASIPTFTISLIIATSISLLLQIVNAGIQIKHSSSSANQHESFAVISFRMIADFWIFGLSLMLTIFSTQKLVEKYSSVKAINTGQTTLFSLWHLLLFVVAMFATFGVGTVVLVARLLGSEPLSLKNSLPYVKAAYFSVAGLIFLYSIIVTLYYLLRVRLFRNPDDKECVNMLSGYILVIACFGLINFIIQSTFAGIRKPLKNINIAAYYVDKVIVLVYTVATLAVFGYWNVELGEDPDQEGLHFSHSRATLYHMEQ